MSLYVKKPNSEMTNNLPKVVQAVVDYERISARSEVI